MKKNTTKNNTTIETPTASAGGFTDLCDSYLKLEAASRRQLETLYKLRETNDISLDAVLSAYPAEKTLLFCSNNIAINYDGLVNYNGAGFHPIDWTPLG